MIPFKLNGKQLQSPSDWEDLTFGQYVGVMENKTGTLGYISIFTGIDIETLKKAKIEGLDMIIQSLSFLRVTPKFEGTATNVGKYALPLNSKGIFDIQLESLGQFEDMRAIIMSIPDKDLVAHTKAYANYCAIYLQKLRDGEYNPDEAIKMVQDVMNMPAHEVIKAGSFFFLKLLNLLTGMVHSSQNIPQKSKKYKLGSKNSAKSLAHMPRSRKSR